MKKRILALILICSLLLGGCAPQSEQRHFFAMDTVMTLQLVGAEEQTFAACEQAVRELEQKCSVTLPESELSLLNRQGEAALSADVAAILEAGLRIHRQTQGAFSLSLYPASRLWGFTEEAQQVPKPEALEAVRPLINDQKIRLGGENGKTVSLEQGMALDLGGIAKGYAADLLSVLLEEQQVEHYFLSLGGNVQVGGGKPDGTPWKIGIADPKGGEYVGVIPLSDGAVVTSGGYQRNFEQDGKIYHHILDPQTLAPAESGLRSVTIVAQSGTLADGLSTALFVMGEQKAMEFCAEQGDFECILITEDDRVVVSEGLKSSFALHNTQYRYEK